MSDDRNSPSSNDSADTPDLAQLHLGRKLWLARFALAWEHTWPALWPALGLGGAFIALALFDILPELPIWLHGIVLAAFLGGVGHALWRGLRPLRFPGIPPAQRRIEKASDLTHRPLTLARDQLAGGHTDPESAALWRLHRQRMLERIKALRIGIPAPGLARLDPRAFRGALLVILVIGLVISWGDGLNRIARALAPGVGVGFKGPAAVDVWITPPAYTGLAPIFLSAGKEAPSDKLVLAAAGGTPNAQNKDGNTASKTPAIGALPKAKTTVSVPEGSTILVQLSGGWGTPSLTLGDLTAAFKPVADGTWKATTQVGLPKDADQLVIHQGAGRVASWPTRIRPDQTPEIRFTDDPAISNRGAVRIGIEGEDDYGFHKAKLYIRRALIDVDTDEDENEEAVLAKLNAPHMLDLPLPGSGVKAIKETSYHDLTAHPWAGTEVVIQVVARDGANQPGVTDPITITLPERRFRHPVARALVLLRKKLTFNPDARDDVVDDLINIGTIPGSFNNDTVVFLAIRSVINRLKNEPGLAVLDGVQSTLWDTALRLEDGQLSLAEKRMRELQKKLMEALNRKDMAEIQKLMRELEKAMAAFLKEMMKGMENMPRSAQPFDPNQRSLSSRDLQRMLDRARELAMTGNLDAARQMLSMLRQMLENLKNGRFAQGRNGQGNQKAWKMLRELRDMMKRQQELMDDTHRRSQEGMQNGKPGSKGEAQRQGDLQKQLQDLLRRFGEMMGKIPKSLGDAELAMREALRELDKNKPGEAVPPQGRALEEMQKGAGAMMQQLMRRFGQGRGRGQGRGGRQRAGRIPQLLDPLGRPLPNAGNSASDDVTIPDESDTQRAREILEELRRRAGELDRPSVEMDYLERLLRRF
ncbi:MAG: hypothetical protein ACI82H_001417 [Alphaproteobacteria bacterium]|jgi:uncharacterized protein (TIGR02302 family)